VCMKPAYTGGGAVYLALDPDVTSSSVAALSIAQPARICDCIRGMEKTCVHWPKDRAVDRRACADDHGARRCPQQQLSIRIPGGTCLAGIASHHRQIASAHASGLRFTVGAYEKKAQPVTTPDWARSANSSRSGLSGRTA
jgi:hypothetical protein